MIHGGKVLSRCGAGGGLNTADDQGCTQDHSAKLIFGHGSDQAEQTDREFFSDATAVRFTEVDQRFLMLFGTGPAEDEVRQVLHGLSEVVPRRSFLEVFEERHRIIFSRAVRRLITTGQPAREEVREDVLTHEKG